MFPKQMVNDSTLTLRLSWFVWLKASASTYNEIIKCYAGRVRESGNSPSRWSPTFRQDPKDPKLCWAEIVYEDNSEAEEIINEVVAAALAQETQVKGDRVGVTFKDTICENYGERDFMAFLVGVHNYGYAFPILGVGSNLTHEFPVTSEDDRNGRPDAVEIEDGKVVTIVECQHYIQKGAYLDDVHWAKATGRYLHTPETEGTVRKVVLIAGGFYHWQVEAAKVHHLEVVLLQTQLEDGKIVLRQVL